MKRYRSHLVHAFFNREYHISPELVNHIIASCDKVPVDVKHCSAAYKVAIKENYQL
jgi:pyruvate-formate lyase-activating enzyme